MARLEIACPVSEAPQCPLHRVQQRPDTGFPHRPGSGLSSAALIQINSIPRTKPTVPPMERYHWYIVGTVAVTAGAICVLLFAM